MSKKIILLALAAASVAAFALPATAMAVEHDHTLHAIGVPTGTSLTIDGVGSATLTANFANVTCKKSSGKATFENTTTGVFEQTFQECSTPLGACTTEGQASGVITTTDLPFHLVTTRHEHNAAITGPAVLVTPNATTGVFAHFSCNFIGKVTVGGTGVIGTITSPSCGGSSTQSTISFSSSSQAVQTHTTVVTLDTETGKTSATPTNYTLTSSLGGNASEDAEGTITFGKSVTLECT